MAWVRLGDRWWLWMQEHPWARWLGMLALIAAFAGLIMGGDFVVTRACAHGLQAACLAQAQP